jgi:hypothetical protein
MEEQGFTDKNRLSNSGGRNEIQSINIVLLILRQYEKNGHRGKKRFNKYELGRQYT